VKLGELEMMHNFVVVENLVSPVILGVDFLHENRLVLDFTTTPVCVHHSNTSSTQENAADAEVLAVYDAAQKMHSKACAVPNTQSGGTDVIDECAIPEFQKPMSIELPECPNSEYLGVVHEYHTLFQTAPGKTDVAYHFIPTTGSPIKVPPRRIPAQF